MYLLLEVNLMEDDYNSHLKDTIWSSFAATLTDDTAYRYRIVINNFENFTKRPFHLCNDDNAQAYSNYLNILVNTPSDILDNNGRKVKITMKTYAFRINVCRSFASFIENNNIIYNYRNPFRNIYISNSNEVDYSNVPTINDIETLLEAAKENSNRDYLIFLLAIRCAMTAKQISKIKISDIVLCNDENASRYGICLHNKGNVRIIAVPADIQDIFTDFINTRPEEGFLFVSDKSGKPMSERTYQRLIKNYIDTLQEKLYQKKFSFHQLRHVAIACMGVGSGSSDFSSVAEYAGLKNVSDTESRYRKISQNMMLYNADFSILSVKTTK